jgi:transcriptional repressor NrdR
MRCPKCGSPNDKVVDSRVSRDADSIRRRRECLVCGHRFTTYETIEEQNLRVIKSDGRYEPFDRNKLIAGITKACEKRPVSREKIETTVYQITSDLEQEHGREIPSRLIGEKIMSRLRQLDEVAYVRFASVYRRFRDVDEFEQEIQNLRQLDTEPRPCPAPSPASP